ncbi:WXG100 family type VII secretion target [Nocardia sp. NPDC003979]
MSSLPPTKSEVRQWNFDSLTEQGNEWGRGAVAVTTEYNTVNQQLADSPGFWRGQAGDAMRVKGEEAKTSLSKVVTAFDNAQPAVTQIVHVLGFAKSSAVNAIKSAEDERYTVAEDGAVSYSSDVVSWLATEKGKSLEVAKAALDQGQRQHEDAIKKALREAGDAAASAGDAIIKVFADVPIPLGADLEMILYTYQVNPDQQKMTKWPSEDFITWVNRFKPGSDVEQKDVTVSEAEMLNNLSLMDQYKFYQISEDASDTAERLFPDRSVDDQYDGNFQDNHADAFRHAYWNAMLTEEFGAEWTEEYTTKHEGREDNRMSREAMDLYNNELGRRIATENPGLGPVGLQNKIIDAWNNGDGAVIDQDGNLARPRGTTLGYTPPTARIDEQPSLPGSLIPDNKPSPK